MKTVSAQKISVIIPTFNRAASLAEALECLLLQTRAVDEVIVVNDAGPSIVPIVSLYAELPIAVLDMSENSKHVHCRNAALEIISGDIVLLLDDDDLLLPTHVAQMESALDDADLVHADAEIVQYKLRDDTRYPISRRVFAYTAEIEQMRQFSTFVPSGTMYRRSLHDQIGYFDEDVYNYWDWDFYLRVAAIGRVKRVAIASVLYAFGGGQNNSADTNKMIPYLQRLSEKHGLGELPTKNFSLLLDEPQLKNREADTLRIWDGQPLVSRYNSAVHG